VCCGFLFRVDPNRRQVCGRPIDIKFARYHMEYLSYRDNLSTEVCVQTSYITRREIDRRSHRRLLMLVVDFYAEFCMEWRRSICADLMVSCHRRSFRPYYRAVD
jgi:hypothetical protein